MLLYNKVVQVKRIKNLYIKNKKITKKKKELKKFYRIYKYKRKTRKEKKQMKKNKKNNFITISENISIIVMNLLSYYILYMHELGLIKTILVFASLKLAITLLKNEK